MSKLQLLLKSTKNTGIVSREIQWTWYQALHSLIWGIWQVLLLGCNHSPSSHRHLLPWPLQINFQNIICVPKQGAENQNGGSNGPCPETINLISVLLSRLVGAKTSILVCTIFSYHCPCLVWALYPSIWLNSQTPMYTLLLGLDIKAPTPVTCFNSQVFLTSPRWLNSSWWILLSLSGCPWCWVSLPSLCMLDYTPSCTNLLTSGPPLFV